MQVTWDPVESRGNLAKHGIRFSDAEVALSDPNALSRPDLTTEYEQRFVSVGLDAIGRVLVTAYIGERTCA